MLLGALKFLKLLESYFGQAKSLMLKVFKRLPLKDKQDFKFKDDRSMRSSQLHQQQIIAEHAQVKK